MHPTECAVHFGILVEFAVHFTTDGGTLNLFGYFETLKGIC